MQKMFLMTDVITTAKSWKIGSAMWMQKESHIVPMLVNTKYLTLSSLHPIQKLVKSLWEFPLFLLWELQLKTKHWMKWENFWQSMKPILWRVSSSTKKMVSLLSLFWTTQTKLLNFFNLISRSPPSQSFLWDGPILFYRFCLSLQVEVSLFCRCNWTISPSKKWTVQ